MTNINWKDRYKKEKEKEELTRINDKRGYAFIVVLATTVGVMCFGPPYSPIITTGIIVIIMLFAKDNLKLIDELQNLGPTGTVAGLCMEYFIVGALFGHESKNIVR